MVFQLVLLELNTECVRVCVCARARCLLVSWRHCSEEAMAIDEPVLLCELDLEELGRNTKDGA